MTTCPSLKAQPDGTPVRPLGPQPPTTERPAGSPNPLDPQVTRALIRSRDERPGLCARQRDRASRVHCWGPLGATSTVLDPDRQVPRSACYRACSSSERRSYVDAGLRRPAVGCETSRACVETQPFGTTLSAVPRKYPSSMITDPTPAAAASTWPGQPVESGRLAVDLR
jgi:hypothetical protein